MQNGRQKPILSLSSGDYTFTCRSYTTFEDVEVIRSDDEVHMIKHFGDDILQEWNVTHPMTGEELEANTANLLRIDRKDAMNLFMAWAYEVRLLKAPLSEN